EFGNFFKQIIMGIKKEGESFAKNIYIETFFQSRFYISFTIAERKSDLLHGGAARFPDMIAADRNSIPFRHFMTAPLKNIGDDTHGRFGWIDIGSSCCIFFQYIILYRAGYFFQVSTLLFGQGNIESK